MAEEISDAGKITTYINENHTVTVTPKGVLMVDDIACRGNLRSYMAVFGGEAPELKFLDNFNAKFKTGLLLKAYYSLLSDGKKSQEERERAAKEKLKTETSWVDIEDYKLVLDVGNSAQVLILNQDYTHTGINEKGMARAAGRNVFDRAVAARAERFLFKYDPYCPDKIILDEEGGVDVLNTYEPPFWKKKELQKVPLPKILEKHLNYFIPCEESRHYLICWLRTALFGRCATYLLLLGAKGTGKSMLCNLLKRAVGSSNFGGAQRSFLSKEFNSILRDRQIIVLDEITASSKEKKEKLKSYINPYATLEAKGVEANKEEKIYASFIITNNSKVNIKLEQDERRFSPMEMAEKSMLEVFGEEFCTEINDEIENNDQLIEDFVSYLYHYDTKDFNTFKAFKGKTFDEVVILSLNIWEQQIFETLTSRKEEYYEYDDVFPKAKNSPMQYRPRSLQLVHDFLYDYKYNGQPIGRLEDKGEMGICFIPCEELMPEDRGFEEL